MTGLRKIGTPGKISFILFVVSMLAGLLVPGSTINKPVFGESAQPQLWAVIVGISERQCPLCVYDQEWNIYPVDVKHPDDSASDLASYLSPVTEPDHIKLLLNDQATNAGIYYAIKWLAESAGASDTALFYFCGHSASQYLGSYDYLISDQQMAQWLDELHSQKVIVVLDTCYAGSFRDELGNNGRVVLMSCQPSETSLEDRELEHAVFTHYILKALDNFAESDVNRNYELSAKEIFDYANPKTAAEVVAPFANLTADSNTQHPTIYIPPEKFGEINLLMQVTVSSDAEHTPGDAVLTVDGKSYASKELPISFTWLSGTSHTLEATRQIANGDGTRLVFASWNDGDTSSSKVISHGGDYTANYGTQYKLTVESQYGQPAGYGWYDSGSNAALSCDTKNGSLIQHTFAGWTGDFTSMEANVAVPMDKNKTIKAVWHNDYLRLILLLLAIMAAVGGIITAVVVLRKRKT